VSARPAYSPIVTLPLPAALSLEGRVALVTGAGSPDGIGFARSGVRERAVPRRGRGERRRGGAGL